MLKEVFYGVVYFKVNDTVTTESGEFETAASDSGPDCDTYAEALEFVESYAPHPNFMYGEVKKIFVRREE